MVYQYIDNEPGLEPGVPEVITVIEIVKVTDIIEIEQIVKEEYDFTWVYITAGCVTPIAIFIIVFLCKSCKKQKAIHITAMKERQPGYERDAMF